MVQFVGDAFQSREHAGGALEGHVQTAGLAGAITEQLVAFETADLAFQIQPPAAGRGAGGRA